jgi:hypothetical protein
MMSDAWKKMEEAARKDLEAVVVKQSPQAERLHEQESEKHVERDGRRYDGRDVKVLKEVVGE